MDLCYIQTLSGIKSSAFDNISSEATLYVPERCGSSYESLLGRSVKNIIEMEE